MGYIDLNAQNEEEDIIIQLKSVEEFFPDLEDDIVNEKYRQYRVCITRQENHNSDNGRKKLFDGYDIVISGDDVLRRTAATICLDGKEREWMSDLQQRVLNKLKLHHV